MAKAEYTPHTWTANEIITSAGLNNMETGIQALIAAYEALAARVAALEGGGATPAPSGEAGTFGSGVFGESTFG